MHGTTPRVTSRTLFVVACAISALAPAVWAIDPVSVSVDTPYGPLSTTVTPGSWSVDADHKATGSGSQTITFAGQSYTLDASWAGVAFDAPTQKLTSGTIALSFASGPATAPVGLDVKIVGMSLDAGTGVTTITGGQIGAPATDGHVGLTMPSMDLTGSTAVLAPAGLIYVSCTTHDPISILGVKFAAGVVLKVDLSSTEAAPNGAIPEANLPGYALITNATPGKSWRGIYLEAVPVTFGQEAAPSISSGATTATIDYLSMGWTGALTDPLAFKGQVTAKSTAPLEGKVFGVAVSLKPSPSDPASGVLRFDSTSMTGAVQGTFDGTVTLASGDSAEISGLSVSYAGGDEFQFIVDSAVVTSPTAGLGFGNGAWSAHATNIGIDASNTRNFTSNAPSTDLTWKGLIIRAGDLSFPVPGAHDGSVLALALTDVAVPFDHPEQFDGWLMLKSGASVPLASVGDLKLQVSDAPWPGPQPAAFPAVALPSATPASLLAHTYFHFVGGDLAAGCLYGTLTIPGVASPVPFGAIMDAGGLIATFGGFEIKVGQGASEITFSDVQATLDLSESQSPSPQAGSPEWMGLIIGSATVTLPSPFTGTITATDLLWDHGLSGTLAATDMTGLGVGSTDKFNAQLTSFSITFSQGDVETVAATGTMEAKPFLDHVTFTTEYDAAAGYLLKADLDGQPHVFGAAGGVLELTFTGLEIKVPTKAAHDNNGARATLRMDGSVSVHTNGASTTSFAFEDVQLRSDGTVNSGGAWIDLRDHAHWEFQKFAVDVREVGFGSVPSTTVPGDHQIWVGLSGGLALSDMWGMSLDVQANKFRWFEDNGFAVEEVKVEATVKQTVSILGKVKYLQTPTRREFRGQVDVKVAVASGQLAAGIQFVSGHGLDQNGDGFNYWGVAGTFTLPVGIPLGSSGLSLYGVNGGVSKHLTPTGPYLYDWTPDAASGFAFQAGVTIGTTADTGYTFHGGVTLTVLIDPLIIRIDGMGNLLTSMSDISNADRVIKASVVYDSTTSTFEASLELGQSDQQPFQLPHVVAVRGLSVMHIGPKRAYMHVGTKSSPVTARVFPDIGGGITASSWFMVDWNGNDASSTPPYTGPEFMASVGAYVGWSFTKSFKICDVTGQIAAGGEVTLTLSPFTFDGSLSASIGAQACGVGFDLSANCHAWCPSIHLHADCTLAIKLLVKTVNLSVAVEQP